MACKPKLYHGRCAGFDLEPHPQPHGGEHAYAYFVQSPSRFPAIFMDISPCGIDMFIVPA